MPLAAGDSLGPYEILALLGAGGMGEVYRARDTRLDRMVALKILSAARMGDEERRRRFLREAKAASALNHANIVTIYDVGADKGMDYLAMELVPGKPLSQLIPRQGLPVHEILRYGEQIADALAKAHSAGIVHRDLKPANVMVTPEGQVKVLDFGLAKVSERAAPGEGTATLTAAAHTEEGTVLGTAAYMSPEQAEGKAVDSRSDVFSFGAMLYEMATGQRAFRGDSQMSVLASVLREDPRPTGEVRVDLPPELERIIMRCLRKDPERRAQSMADLRVALAELREDSDSGKLKAPSRPVPAGSRRSTAWLVAAVAAALLVAGFFGWRVMGGRSGAEQPLEPVPLTNYPGDEAQPSFSPDGNQVAFTWDGEQEAGSSIYVKLIGSEVPLRLTNDPHTDYGPRWSPDGRNVAFLRRVAADTVSVLLVPPLGGAERKVGQFYSRTVFSNPLAWLCWTPDSRYLLVSGSETRNQSNRMLRVSVDTGEVKTLAAVDDVSDGYTRPALSPDGGTLAMIRFQGAGSIELLSLSRNFEPAGLRKLAWPGADAGALAWTTDGRDLIATVAVNIPLPLYRIPVAGGPAQPLTWSGPGSTFPAVAPQGHRLAFVRSYRDTNIWQVSLDLVGRGQPAMQRLASSSFREVAPDYSPDGKRLAFHSNRGGSVQVWTADADGARATQLTSMDQMATTGTPRWSPDGQYIAFDSNAGGSTHIYVIKADGGQPRALTTGSSNNFVASWSHDGRWIYFTSNRSGELQIWRAPSGGGAAVQITRKGGEAGAVSPDGQWLFFTRNGGADGIWKAPVDGGEETRVTDNVFRYNFAITPQGLYWVPAAAADLTSSVRFLNFATGATTEIVKIEKPVDLGLAVSPDGRRLLFTQVDYAGQDLMLVENFR